MEMFTNSPNPAILSIAAILLILLIRNSIKLRRAKTKLAVNELTRMFREESHLNCIYMQYREEPIGIINLIKSHDIENYVNLVITNYQALLSFLSNTQNFFNLHPKRKAAISRVITEAIKKVWTPEKFAEAYVDCLFYENKDDLNYEMEKNFIIEIMEKDSKNQPIFFDSVLEKLEKLSKSNTLETMKILIKNESIKFNRRFDYMKTNQDK